MVARRAGASREEMLGSLDDSRKYGAVYPNACAEWLRRILGEKP
jgi:hypothetical protein